MDRELGEEVRDLCGVAARGRAVGLFHGDFQ